MEIKESFSTICAVSTPRGKGGISVIRVSGDEAFTIVKKILSSKKDLEKAEGYTILFGNIYDGETKVDEVLVSVFRSPHSFTGENVCEISCHGGVVVTEKIISLLLENGCEAAEPGEFTKRAFMNGKMSLSQAEAVHDIIEAKSLRALNVAVNNLGGALSNKIDILRDKMIKLLAQIQVSTDFPDEDIEAFTEEPIKNTLEELYSQTEEILKSANEGIYLANGAKCAIAGIPNTGKSSLLNALIGEEKAIVTSKEGTTRDVVEGRCEIGGIAINFLDTAGIRDAGDEIEEIGIAKTKKAIDEADFIIFVTESGRGITPKENEILADIDEKDKKVIYVLNKCDIFHEKRDGYISISAKEREGLEELLKEIGKTLEITNENTLVANERQRHALMKARTALMCAINTMEEGFFADLAVIDISEAAQALGEVDGESVNDEVVDRIFRDFCLGK